MLFPLRIVLPFFDLTKYIDIIEDCYITKKTCIFQKLVIVVWKNLKITEGSVYLSVNIKQNMSVKLFLWHYLHLSPKEHIKLISQSKITAVTTFLHIQKKIQWSKTRSNAKLLWMVSKALPRSCLLAS